MAKRPPLSRTKPLSELKKTLESLTRIQLQLLGTLHINHEMGLPFHIKPQLMNNKSIEKTINSLVWEGLITFRLQQNQIKGIWHANFPEKTALLEITNNGREVMALFSHQFLPYKNLYVTRYFINGKEKIDI
jgi:hypothetical protein